MSLQNKAGYGIEEEPLEPTSLFESQGSEGDASLNTVVFNEGEDANLTSGSTLSVLFGKIKYFINNIASYFGNIITASASVDNSTGTPSVTVTKTVTQDNKIDISFEFSNLKGADGKDGRDGKDGTNGTNGTDGVTPNITATANVTNTSGVPSVTVTKTGTNEAPNFDFAFSNLKGNDGQNGTNGTDGQNGVTPSITASASVDGNTGTPSVNVTKTGTDENPVFNFAFSNLKGASGQDGQNGTNGTNGVGIASITKTGTNGLVDTYTITYTDGSTSNFTVTNGADGADGQDGTDGTNGTDGVGITSILKTGTSGLVDTYTITYTDNTTSTFTVTNGQNGTNGTNGVGVPTGGTAGQVLSKVDGQDYNTEWTTPSGGGPTMQRTVTEISASATPSSMISARFTPNAQYDGTKDYIQVLIRANDSMTVDNVEYGQDVTDSVCFRFNNDTEHYKKLILTTGYNNSTHKSVPVFALIDITKRTSYNYVNYDFVIEGYISYYNMTGTKVAVTSSNWKYKSFLDVRAYYF